tara:strand:- start:692 stop:850 length:159 start_codon:yes stop_codon:yes gene_type:complete
MKMISPDGSSSIDAHPTRVEYLLKKGWKGEAIQETQIFSKKTGESRGKRKWR